MKKALAEVIGTFALVFIGTGAIVSDSGDTGLLAIGLAFGLTLMAMAFSVGTVSGAHLNPAVSLAMFINKRMDFKAFGVYIVAQLAGALAASATLRFVLSAAGREIVGLGETVLSEGVSVAGGFVIEMLLTFLFVLVIVTVTGRNGNGQMAGLVIGLTLTAMIFMGGTLTGASLNAARSFGPAVLMGGAALSQLWLYVASTLVGGALAAVVANFVLDTEAGDLGPEKA
ncbi:MIP/aquaporin family protein [Fundicoccus sp. Sow4_F4]|uniref:MIP/aquaporin family protein n=1 Tax=Fundicoccus sp. Sow4_F4 TaxID=3438783 RepID=UPI003F919F73